MLEEVSRNFYKGLFEQNKDISDSAVIKEILRKTFDDESAEKYLNSASDDRVKKKLIQVTNELVVSLTKDLWESKFFNIFRRKNTRLSGCPISWWKKMDSFTCCLDLTGWSFSLSCWERST